MIARTAHQGEIVWKFRLRPWTIFIDVPRGARVLSVGAQGSDVVAWLLCASDEPVAPRLLAAWATGEVLPRAAEGAAFVGTVQMDDGLVFHVFDGGEQP